MAAYKSLADGKRKLTLCLTKPTDPENPTPAELNAGIDASCDVLDGDFTWGATDSEKVNEKMLCTKNNANSLGADNLQAAFTVARVWDSVTKQFHETGDATYQAVKAKGTTLWGYLRESAKDADEPWATGDEFDGLELLTDTPQRLGEGSGYIKRRIPCEPQNGWIGGEVAAATP